ncbi:MAG: hypothetical protein NT046_00380 [Arenimonas sp.]|nr:hypothetical protein [Arenimonas sp.]
MTDPRIEGSLGDLNFRSPGRSTPRREEAPDRFWLGVAIFIGVALVHPFYAYQVQSRLAERELSDALTEAGAELGAYALQAQRQSREAVAQSAARAVSQRQSAVTVAGTTVVGETRIVIVHLGQATLREAKASICRQAAYQFKEPLAGERLRVQRHRGSLPAVDAGTIICD